jgi:hypothetical protein
MADLNLRAQKIARAAASAIADYRRKQAAQSQQIWCIVNETGMLDFTGQSQIASVPVYESEWDAQYELENLADEDMAGWSIKEATLTFKDAAPAEVAPITSSEKAAAPMDDVVLPSKKRWPEFMPLVEKLKVQAVRGIQSEADKIKSDMPYKQQAVLEMLIHELQELV